MEEVTERTLNSPSRDCGDFGEFEGKVCKGTVFPGIEKSSTRLLSVSASAQDLRSFEMEKDSRDASQDYSPRGVLDEGLRCSESETNSSKASTSYSEAQEVQSSQSPWQGFLRLWRKKSMRRLSTFPRIGVPKIPRGRSSKEGQAPRLEANGDADFCFCRPSWKSFTLSELEAATNNFSPENIIGKGGYAEVYKGCLANGQFIAIKKLTKGTMDERTSNFLSELGTIVHVNHPNTAKLIGFAVEGGMHLVLQLSPHGSLASVLHGSEKKLEWNARYRVAIGTAEGLEYLHDRCQRRIIHRDIKAANILLTEDFEPQICDFGLAKWLPDMMTHHTVSTFEGTFGYLAPEYLTHGIVDEKTDVYAFGVLLLELISGRKAVDSSQQSIVIWAKPFLEANSIKELVDPLLADDYDFTQANYVAQTASFCIQQSPVLRPRMVQALNLLRGEEDRSEPIRVQRSSFLRRTYSEELFDAEEYNGTRYLNDLKQHRQLALNF